jgi:SPP1 family predicted phage head-tail adaptor
MKALGSLRHRVQLQSPTNTTDAGGGITQAWTTIANVYCSIEPKTGSESFRQGQVQDRTTHEIAMRYRSNISTKYRILFGSRTLNIRHIKNLYEKDRFLVLECSEGEAI